MTLAELGDSLRDRLRRRVYWAAFALVAGLYACFLAYARTHGAPLHSVLLQMVSGCLFYAAFVWLAPLPWQWDGRPGSRRIGLRQAAQAFLASEILMMLILALEETLTRRFGDPPYDFSLYLMNLCFQGPALFLVGLLFCQQDRLSQEWLASRRQAQEATGHQLKSQMHPHALFNSLTGLAELIEDDPPSAEVFVEAMSGFLRRILEASRLADWPLEEERRLAEDFLVMEGLRLGSRMQVAWAWDQSLDGQAVSPLLVQPLLENAIKHGINGCEAGGQIRVEARREGAELCLEVGNTGAPISASGAKRQGVGLQNLQRRLELAYGARAAFRIQRQDEDWTWASVRLAIFPSES